MNIRSTQRGIHLDRGKSKKAFQQAQKKEAAAEKAQFDSIAETTNHANGVALKAGIGTAVASLGTLAGMTYATNAAVDGSLVLASLAIGASLGMLVASGAQQFVEHKGGKARQETTLPALQSAREEFVVARENYRNALLQELDDEGVVTATQPTWEKMKKEEATSPHLVSFRETKKDLGTHLGYLESLANGRQATGWVHKMAHLEDNPQSYSEQRAAVSAHPTLQKMMECNNS